MRFAFVALPGVISLFLIARAFIDANRADLRYAAVVSALLAATFLIRVGEPAKQPLRRVSTHVLIGLNLLLLPFTVVVLIFGRVDKAGFIFNLVAGVGGTPWRDMAPFIVTALVLHATLVISVIRVRPALDRMRVVVPGLMLFLLMLNPLATGLFMGNLYNRFFPKPSLVTELARVPLQVPAEKPNLVILYLEGFDRGFTDADRFGDIAAPVRSLEAQGLSFTNVEQITATGWSLAGMVATQCGVPLLPSGAVGVYDDLTSIVPNVRCLPDILAGMGYDLSYITGATITGDELGYYGYGAYFSRSAEARILDEPAIRREMTDGLQQTEGGWALPDATVLSFALRHVAEKAQQERPFAVLVATMDTHGPKAVVSPECTADGKGRIGDSMAPAIACTARLAEAFVRSIRATHGDRVKIAVMSDHLNHMSDLADTLEREPRRNTVIFLDPDRAGERIDRAASMVDIFPTLLDWLGFLPDAETRAGLGTSLLSPDRTLIERLGGDEVNARLDVDVDLALRLWGE